MLSATKKLDFLKKQAVMRALEQTGGEQSAAARLLGLHRDATLNRMRQYGVWLARRV